MRSVAILFSFALLVQSVFAQGRPWGLPAEADYPNRYEGVMPTQVANPDFELLSFVGGSASFREGDELKVDFFLPATSPVMVRAQELRDDKYYRMLSKPATWTANQWNTFGPWPVAAVITPKQVARDNLGVVVYLDSTPETAGELAPAFVYSARRVAASSYTFVFRTRNTLRRVEYALRQHGAAAPLWSKTADGDFIRGTPIYLDVPVMNLAEGRYTLQLTCVPVSATAPRVQRQFAFHHAR